MASFNHPKKYHLTVERWFFPFRGKLLKNRITDLIKSTLIIRYSIKNSKTIKENNNGQKSWNILCSKH